MYIRPSLTVPPRPALLAIPVFLLILAIVLILIFRKRCPVRLPHCLRPCRYFNQLFAAESALDEIIVDACSSPEIITLQAFNPNTPASSTYPCFTIQSMSQTFPAFSSSSRSSSSGSEGLPSLDDDRRGRKRKRVSSSDDESDHWMLEERHYLLPHPPLTEADVIRRLEKSFTGVIPDGGIPEFLFRIGKTE